MILSKIKIKNGRVIKDEDIIPSGTLVRFRFSSVNPYIWFEGKIIKYKEESKEYWVENKHGQDVLVKKFDVKRN